MQLLARGQRRSGLQSDLSPCHWRIRVPNLTPGTEGERSERPNSGCKCNALTARCKLGDALIAGTAKAHDLAVATRNVADFRRLDIEVVNPWDIP